MLDSIDAHGARGGQRGRREGVLWRQGVLHRSVGEAHAVLLEQIVGERGAVRVLVVANGVAAAVEPDEKRELVPAAALVTRAARQ